MTDRVISFLDTLKSKEYRKNRKIAEYQDVPGDRFMKSARLFIQTEKTETPILYKGDIFGFNHTVANLAGDVQWRMNNFTPDYAWAMQNGFSDIRKALYKSGEVASSERKGFFLSAADHIDGIFDLTERYQAYAEENGVNCLADALKNVTMNFPLAVRRATMCSLIKCDSYDAFFTCVCQSLYDFFEQLKIKAASDRSNMKTCNPYASLYIRGCRQKGLDYTEHGAKYNNDGVHGLGIAPAVDELAAIKKLCFDEKTLDKKVLVKALDADFEGFDDVRNMLHSCPKTGNKDNLTNGIMSALLDFYAKTVDNVPNSVGGVFRAGTGGSQDYVTKSRDVGATADGRKAGQPYPASFSPSIGVKANGPLSVVQTFTSFDMTKIIN